MKDLIKRVLTVICAVGVMSAYTGIIASASEVNVRPMPGTDGAASVQTEDKPQENTDNSNYGVSGIDTSRVRTTSADSMDLASNNNVDDEEDGDTQSSEGEPVQNGEGDQAAQPPTIIPANAYDANVPQAQPQEEPQKERNYVTMGGMLIWFLLAVVLNAAISFWVANRFYKMSRKDTHVTAEVRALRRDVEEKFVSNVGGFTEMENEISNNNEDYSMEGGGIKIPDRKAKETPMVSDGFEEDAFRQWEMRQAEVQTRREQAVKESRNVEKTQKVNTSRARQRRDDAEREQPRKKQYQPNRSDADYEDDETYERSSKRETAGSGKTAQNLNNVKNKAKEFLGDIFPFKDDEDE